MSGDRGDAALRQQVKDEIRRRMRALREALPPDARQSRSAKIAEHVLSLPEYGRARCVTAFTAVRGEADPGPIIEDAVRSGKAVAMPRVAGDQLVLHEWREGSPTVLSPFGIPEPSADAPRVDEAFVDFVVVPALAVDERGHRVGYGKGYYDRLLPRLRAATRCIIAYDFQIIVEVPIMDFDFPCELVATDARIIRPAHSS